MDTGNPFLDHDFPSVGPTPDQGAKRIHNLMKNLIEANERILGEVREIVALHGKAAIVASMGAQKATELEALYNAVGTMIKTVAARTNVPDIESTNVD